MEKVERHRRNIRVGRMLMHWAEVLVFRSEGGVGYPSGSGDGKGGGGSGLSQVGEDYLVIEEALTRLEHGYRQRIRRRIEAEYTARVKDRPWSVMGWIEDVCAEDERRPWGRRIEAEYRMWRQQMALELVDAEDVAA